jgi:hypothetical protein
MCNKVDRNSNMNYKERLNKLFLNQLQVRRELLCLKIVLKCIYDHSDIPNKWKSNFIVKQTPNGLMIVTPKTRISLCDKNLFIFAIKLFNCLPIEKRNENIHKKFLKQAQLFLCEKSRCNQCYISFDML